MGSRGSNFSSTVSCDSCKRSVCICTGSETHVKHPYREEVHVVVEMVPGNGGGPKDKLLTPGQTTQNTEMRSQGSNDDSAVPCDYCGRSTCTCLGSDTYVKRPYRKDKHMVPGNGGRPEDKLLKPGPSAHQTELDDKELPSTDFYKPNEGSDKSSNDRTDKVIKQKNQKKTKQVNGVNGPSRAHANLRNNSLDKSMETVNGPKNKNGRTKSRQNSKNRDESLPPTELPGMHCLFYT